VTTRQRDIAFRMSGNKALRKDAATFFQRFRVGAGAQASGLSSANRSFGNTLTLTARFARRMELRFTTSCLPWMGNA